MNQTSPDIHFFLQSIHFLFSEEEYDKILRLNENLSSFSLSTHALSLYHFIACRSAARLNDQRSFDEHLILLQAFDELQDQVCILKAEQAFIANDLNTALLELRKINATDHHLAKELSQLYECRSQLLNGEILSENIDAQILQGDPFYQYFLFIIQAYRLIDQLSVSLIEIGLAQLSSIKYNFPDTHIVLAQVYLIANDNAKAEMNVLAAKNFFKNADYVDLLELQVLAENLQDFSLVNKQADDFINTRTDEAAMGFLKSITIEKKKDIPETILFKYILQTKLKLEYDDEIALQAVGRCKSKYKTYPQTSFLSCVAANIYSKLGDSDNAASEFYSAGIGHYNNNNFKEAARWLGKAYINNRAFVKAGWYLSDSLYINSYTGVFPYTDADKLNKAIDVTDACFKTLQEHDELLGTSLSWVYLLKAYLHEKFSVKTEDPNEETRKALAFIEMALLNDPVNVTRIKTATRIFSNLRMDNNAFALSEPAQAQYPNDAELLEEYTRVALNKGDFERAEILLSRLNELNPAGKEVYNGWESFSLYIRSTEDPKLLSVAIKLLEDNLTKENSDLWTHFSLMHYYWLAGDFEKASLQADWVLGIEHNNNYNAKSAELAFSYYLKGNLDKAIEHNQDYCKSPENIPSAWFDASCYFIESDDLQRAEEFFNKMLSSSLKGFEIKNYRRYYTVIEERANANQTENAGAIHELIYDVNNGFIPRLNTRLQTIASNENPVINEVQGFLEKPGYEEHSWGWFALQLTLFRSKVADKKLVEAITCFANVMNDERSRLYSLTWQNAADFIALATKDDSSFAGAYTQVNKIINSQLTNEIALIRNRLMDVLHDNLATRNKISWQLPAIPIVLELANELIPAEALKENDTANWDLFTDHIPAFKKYFKSNYAVEIPGIRVRPFEFFKDADNGLAYQIQLNEVPIVLGRVYPGYLYCYQSTWQNLVDAGIDDKDIINSIFQIRNMGVWVKSKMEYLLAENDILYWSNPIAYIMNHVQFVIESNLNLFVGTQQAENLLDECRKSGFENVITTLFSNNTTIKKTRFGKILRALAEERVSLKNAAAILGYCKESDLDKNDINIDLQNIRERLQDDLKDKIDGKARLMLPAYLEQQASSWICHDEEKIFMQALPGDVQQWLSGFRDFIGDNRSAEIILVNSKQVRRFIKKMVELEYPQLEIIENFN